MATPFDLNDGVNRAEARSLIREILEILASQSDYVVQHRSLEETIREYPWREPEKAAGISFREAESLWNEKLEAQAGREMRYEYRIAAAAESDVWWKSLRVLKPWSTITPGPAPVLNGCPPLGEVIRRSFKWDFENEFPFIFCLQPQETVRLKFGDRRAKIPVQELSVRGFSTLTYETDDNDDKFIEVQSDAEMRLLLGRLEPRQRTAD